MGNEFYKIPTLYINNKDVVIYQIDGENLNREIYHRNLHRFYEWKVPVKGKIDKEFYISKGSKR